MDNRCQPDIKLPTLSDFFGGSMGNITIGTLYEQVLKMNAEIAEIKEGIEELEARGIRSGTAWKILQDKYTEVDKARQAFMNRQVQLVSIR